MAWLGEGLSSLKGQISNFTKEVLSEVTEAREDGCGHESELLDAKEKIQHLESLCSAKDLEISKLREKNAALERAKTSQFQPKKQQSLLYHVGSSPNLGGNFPFGDPDIVRREVTFDFSSMEAEKDDLVDYLRAEIRALKIEKEKVEKKMEVFQKKCSCLEIYPESTDKSSPRGVSYGMEKSDMVYPKGQKADDGIDGTEANLPASFQENEVPHGEGQDFDGESGVNNHLLEKQTPIHLNHVKHLNNSEPQHNSKRRSFDSSLKCSLDVPGIEVEGDKLMDARGECDGSEEIPKDVVKLMDQISKLTISLSDAQLNVNQLQEKEKIILREMERIKDEELKAKDKVKSLSAELETIHEYNHQLVQKLDETDKQNSAATEELMAALSSVKCENEVLKSELKGIETKSNSLECELQTCLANSKTMHREIELELEKEILKFIPPELIPREPRSNGCGGEVSVVVGAVKGLSKALEEQRWKRDTLERKLSEMMKEAREVKAECVLLRGEIARRESSSALRATEGLAPILETGEEEDEEEDEEAADSRGSQKNAEDVEGGTCDRSEPNWQARCLALEEEVKRLISERTSWCKDSDVCDVDDDDADGIEEVNDWTWQAAEGEKTLEFKSVSLGGNVFVEDGEHAITTISNDVGVVNQLASVENSGPANCDVQTLNDECVVGNSELRSEIEELLEQKGALERALGEAREATVQMEGKILALSVDLEAKTRTEMELLEKENELRSKLSQHETKIDSLEKLLFAESASVEKLETEIASLTSSLLNEKRGNEDIEKQAMELRLQVTKLENQLKNNEDSLAGNAEFVIALEDKCKILEQKVEEEAKMKEENLNLVTYLEGKVASLQAHLEQEHKLAEDALGRVEGFEKENEGLKGKMAQEIKLKEEALSKLKDTDSRFHVFEQSVLQEIQSKNELSDMVVELQRSLAVAEEVAKVERGQKEEAMVRVGEQDVLLKKLNEEVSVARKNLQEKEACISGHLEKIQALEMERERIMCVVGDKAREVSSLRSERQRLMEAMSSMEKMRRGDITVVGDAYLGPSVDSLRSSGKDGLEGTSTPPGEKEPVDLDDDGTVQLLAKLSNLQLESEQLAESYRQEQQRNKHLQNEVHELLEKETALQEELQRLRVHLVAVEDRYTKEAVNAEDHIAFLKNKLTQVEERLHASSSAYTSASVRSNQQVESLENQVRALTEKRDESKSKLKAAEELLAQQAKDLTNLQTVLEQFQKDKDREISIVKDKMGVELLSVESRCRELSEEILSLKEQLHQAQEGLSAAARLSEQADKKSEIISSLRTELKKLNAGLIAAEERLQSASLSVEGKVDKNLVKNLLVGYLSSPVQGSRRNEILRIIATILEFSPDEKVKADLVDGPGKGSGWLRGWGGGHLRDGNPASGLTQPSLSEAFIRFLESESRPKSVPQLHMISEARTEQARPSSPALGHSRTSSTSSSPPLLLPESILPTLPTFPVASGSSSSCILKDVLKDS